jgi:hypothetical protein
MAPTTSLTRVKSCPSTISCDLLPSKGTRKVTQCRNCKETGHNKRTCARTTLAIPDSGPVTTPPSSDSDKKERKVTQCGTCKETGHNKRTCVQSPKPLQDQTNKTNETNDDGKTIKKPRVCGACGGAGHNKRTCPVLVAFLTMGVVC